jgi:hypothetical protein
VAIGQDTLPVFPLVFPVSKFLFADHGIFRVWRSETRLLGFKLFTQKGFTGSRSDEPEERGGRIEWPAAKFRVGLHPNEERVVCQKAEREGSRLVHDPTNTYNEDVPRSSSHCILCPFSS